MGCDRPKAGGLGGELRRFVRGGIFAIITVWLENGKRLLYWTEMDVPSLVWLARARRQVFDVDSGKACFKALLLTAKKVDWNAALHWSWYREDGRLGARKCSAATRREVKPRGWLMQDVTLLFHLGISRLYESMRRYAPDDRSRYVQELIWEHGLKDERWSNVERWLKAGKYGLPKRAVCIVNFEKACRKSDIS